MTMAIWSAVMFMIVVMVEAQPPDLFMSLATKTPYYAQQETYTAVPAGCVAVHVEYLSRHGSRQPTKSGIRQLDDLSATLRANAAAITNPTYAWMKTWRSPYDRAMAGELIIPTGADELYATARRMLATYGEVFAARNYTPADYVFQSTQVPRSGQSGSSFVYGLFEGRGSIGAGNFMPYYMYSNSTDTDLMLRFFDNCPTYSRDVELNPASRAQSQRYAEQQLPPIADEVSVEIGGDQPAWRVDAATLSAMWTACQYEIVIANDTSLFCSLFDADDVAVFNYAADLDYYYINGPGNPLNYQPAYLLLQDMVIGLKCARLCSTEQKSRFPQPRSSCPTECTDRDYIVKLRFAHAETVMPFVALLGIFNDASPLTADWSPQAIAARKWKTSVVAPFAANDNLVLYRCPADTYRVKYLHNEKEYTLPGCSDLYCDFDTFSQLVAPLINQNFATLCNYSACPPSSPHTQPNQNSCVVAVAASAAAISTTFLLLLAAVIYLIIVVKRKKRQQTGEYFIATMDDE